MTYPGGKNGSGIYQRIINHMPPHKVYFEAFLGSGAVMRHKRPAARNFGVDMSADAIGMCVEMAGEMASQFDLLHGDALELLPVLRTTANGSVLTQQTDTLVYADPPYMLETRKGGELYEFEMDDAQHKALLATLCAAGCLVMISGYRSALYDDALSDWRRVDYPAMTRRGQVTESLWMNFSEPRELHDYSHLGDNYRERERIRRKTARWTAKLQKMDRMERLALIDAMSRTPP